MAHHVDQQELPELIQQYISNLAKRIRNRHIRRDVVAELSAHFADALTETPEDADRDELAAALVAEFGDAKNLRLLIKRAKKRCQPMWLKVVGYICRTLIIVFVISFIYTSWFLSGKPTPSVDYVAQFNEATRPVADESLNAAPYYLKAFKLYVAPEKRPEWTKNYVYTKHRQLSALRTDPQEFKIFMKWLQANDPAIEALRLATAKPYCWFKSNVGQHSEHRVRSIRVSGLFLSSSWQLANVLSWRMHFAAEQGDWNSFASDLKLSKTLARHLMQGSFFSGLVPGVGIDEGSRRQLVEFLQRYSLPPGALQRLAQVLEESFPSGYPIADMSLEVFDLLDTVQRLFTDDGSGDGHLVPSVAGRFFGPGTVSKTRSYYVASPDDPYFVARALIHPSRRATVKLIHQWKQMSQRDLSQTPYQNHILGESFEAWLEKTREENPRNLFIQERWTNTQQASRQSYAGRAKYDATRTIVALLRYKAEYGQFPDSLDELVPEYLKAVPLDPFGPGPLTYKRQGDDFILYSWGLNFKDDDGRFDTRVLRMEDVEGDYVFWPFPRFRIHN